MRLRAESEQSETELPRGAFFTRRRAFSRSPERIDHPVYKALPQASCLRQRLHQRLAVRVQLCNVVLGQAVLAEFCALGKLGQLLRNFTSGEL